VGLLLRRPLEAMTRTLPLVALMFIPIVVFGKYLYQWIRYPDAASTNNAYLHHLITHEQALTANFKRPMLNPHALIVESCIIFAVLFLFMFLLNKWSLDRDADPLRGTQASYERWRTRFENLSGPGILIYVILLTAAAIVWIQSLDVTWYSSIWGLQFLVAQGYAVLALGILSVVLLSRYEPMKTLLRATEQHDLGKFAFAFVMLNIYLCFAEFLIIWSGNLPDEIPWYLNRIHGGWWTICTLDFCLPLAHPLLPAALARPEAQQAQDDLDCLLHDLRAPGRHVLAHRAELRRIGRKPAHRRRNAGVHHCAHRAACAVVGVLHHAVDGAASGQHKRSASGRAFGA
jgi:hypothetical protein